MACCGHDWEPKHGVPPFTCGGCRQGGLQSQCECSKCGLRLHGECAQALDGKPSITHFLFPGRDFLFLDSPPARARHCHVCGLDITGYHYHCSGRRMDMHPCCAVLPPTRVSGDRVLYLRAKMASRCHKCGKMMLRLRRRRKTWCYVSSCDEFHLHVACMNEMLLSGREDMLPRASAVMNVPGRRRGRAAWLALKLAPSIVSAVRGDPTSLLCIAASFTT